MRLLKAAPVCTDVEKSARYIFKKKQGKYRIEIKLRAISGKIKDTFAGICIEHL